MEYGGANGGTDPGGTDHGGTEILGTGRGTGTEDISSVIPHMEDNNNVIVEDSLVARTKEVVTKEKGSVTMAMDTVTTEKGAVAMAPDDVTMEKGAVAMAPDDVTMEKGAVAMAQDVVTKESGAVTIAKDVVTKENGAVAMEKDNTIVNGAIAMEKDENDNKALVPKKKVFIFCYDFFFVIVYIEWLDHGIRLVIIGITRRVVSFEIIPFNNII